MCIGIPMQLVEIGTGVAVAARGDTRERLDVMLLGDVAPGTWVLAFHGRALKTLTEAEARDTDRALAALEAVMAGGTDVDHLFADLVGREPTLPPHLRKPT